MIPLVAAVLALAQATGALAPVPTAQRDADAEVRGVLERTRPPGGSGVSLQVLLEPRTVQVGEQVDYVVAAWFPSQLRARMRRAPELELPPFPGFWVHEPSGPARAPVAAVAHGESYDVYLVRRHLLALRPARQWLPGARLAYAVPHGFSLFSREELHERRGDSLEIEVRPLPERGRPADFGGAVGRRLTAVAGADDSVVRVGEVAVVWLELRGEGNAPLWPEPALTLPAGARAVSEDTDLELLARGGRLLGRKRFRWMVSADSAGSMEVRAIGYPFFDLDRRAYARAVSEPVVVAVVPAGPFAAPPAGAPFAPTLTAATFAPPPANGREVPTLARFSFGALAGAAALPPAVALLVAAFRRLRWRSRRSRREGPAVPPGVGALHAAEQDLRNELARAVGISAHAGAEQAGIALRAAGASEETIARVVAALDSLLARRFAGQGGEGAPADEPVALARAAREALACAFRSSRSPRLVRGLMLALALSVGAAAPAAAEVGGPAGRSGVGEGDARADAERAARLYAAGLFAPAAREYLAAASVAPRAPALWYAAGVALLRSGASGPAVAAWLRAKRLVPRRADVRVALGAVAPSDAATRALWRTLPLRSDECLVVAFALWTIGWGLVAARVAGRAPPGTGVGAARGRRGGIGPAALSFALALVALGLGVVERRIEVLPLAVVTAPDAVLRDAPSGLAAGVGRLAPGATFLVVGTPHGGFVRLRQPGGMQGWVREREVERL